ncbi:MAG: 2OG-Fe(II) oxygenase [Thermodesulfobacteriota bacterium]
MNTVTSSSFGLFVKKSFLDADLCAGIRAEMSSAGGNPSSVVKSDERLLDEKYRRTVTKDVSDETRALLTEKLTGAKAELEAYFGVELSHPQEPQFLFYREGDFFQVHVDRGTDPKNPEAVRERKVSAIIFFNNETDEPGDETYTGGSLIIYGILKDPRFESRGFKVPGAAGMLLAFRSDLFHEVTPVTSGSRYTVVSWFD